MMRNFKLFGAMLVFLVSLESCKGCAIGDDDAAYKCPTGQINIDDGKTATSCKAVVHVANLNDLVAEIQKATAGGNWTANLNYIDTSAVTDMSNLFGSGSTNNLEKFNGQIDKWNTSNVTDMSYMFQGAKAFNQPIGNWNTEKVTDMSWMFKGAAAFDQPIGNWKTDNVTEMNLMFSDAVAFNQPIGNWKTDNAKNMMQMFSGAAKFNQPIGNWNVSNAAKMTNMFNNAAAFDQDISKWNFPSTSTFDYALFFTGSAMLNKNNVPTHANWYCLKGMHDGGCPP